MWENLELIPPANLPMRRPGPPTLASGTGVFEYFLPLVAILGDIIEVHHRRRHPRLCAQEDSHSVAVIQELLATYELSLASLTADGPTNSPLTSFGTPVHANRDLVTGLSTPALYQDGMRLAQDAADHTKVRLVKAYSTHILHVLHVLLHGKWDAISMLDDGDDWITSKRFTECAAHAISASQSVSTILALDPELTFMSYLFGIYLLQGSFILLLFADRMPQLGPNESVERACENIIRAHEVCVVTLSTDFQVSRVARRHRAQEADPRNRKTFARWCGRPCTAFGGRARPTGRSTEQGAERCRCIGGQRAPGGWHCNDVECTTMVSTCSSSV